MNVTQGSQRRTVQHLRDAVFFDGDQASQKLSRFWILLVLAAIIAAAGVVADSTVTVIGAMIVAPMMTPIQGIMVATVLGDKRNLARSILLVASGALVVVAIAYIIGVVSAIDIIAATNSQVSARVNPRLIDLLAALGTGVVGSIALVRKDISDTLPGVAIAISLVPPLSVVGATLEAGAYAESAGALLLFLTNVSAILLTGIIVMGIYRVHAESQSPQPASHRRPRKAVITIVAMVILIGIPLTGATVASTSQALRLSEIQSIAQEWLAESPWRTVSVSMDTDLITIQVAGPDSPPNTAELAERLEAEGIDLEHVHVEFLPSTTVALGSG